MHIALGFFPSFLLVTVLASIEDKPTGVDSSVELLECMKRELECSKRELACSKRELEFSKRESEFLKRETEFSRREMDFLTKMHTLNNTVTFLNQTVFEERDKKEGLVKYMLILAVRSRIEELEVMILSRKDRKKPRNIKWTQILTGNIETMHCKEEVLSLRKRIPENWHGDCVRMISIIYGDFSDNAAHRVKHPINYTDDTVKEMFQSFSITPDEKKVNAVKAILEPLP